MKTTALSVSGIVLAGILGVSIWSDQRRRKRDRLASRLLTELSILTDPSKAGILSEDAFATGYLDSVLQVAGGRVIVMKESAASRIAQQIDDAWGFWNHDEDQINSAFRSLRDKVQVSQVATAYRSLTDFNLIDHLTGRLDEGELQTVLDIVTGLSPYRLIQN